MISSLLKELTESGGDLRFREGRVAGLTGIPEPQRGVAVKWK
jgi:hypothetical protein